MAFEPLELAIFSRIQTTVLRKTASDAGFYLKKPQELEKKLLNFAHHYEFEKSGLDINDIKKFMEERRVIYEHNIDQKSFKWSGKSKLKKIDLNLLPKHISSNLIKYEKWLD